MENIQNNFSGSHAPRVLFGFTAGFVATLVFHQLAVLVLWKAGIAPFAPFSLAPVKPYGVPAVISLAFWGGIWGIVFAELAPGFRGRYWMMAFLFGAILPTAVALTIVWPLKGRPLGNAWPPALMLTAFVVNGAWGIGTGLFYKMLYGRFGPRRART